MKNLFQFLTEAGASQASAQAQKLNLKSDGHGSWFDSRGNMVAVTDKGKLKFTKKKLGKVEDDKAKPRTGAQQPAPKPRAAAPQEAPKQKKVAPQDQGGGDKAGGGDTLTLAFGRFNPPTVGHEKLLSAARKASAGGELKIYPSRTVDNKKNPIDPDMKVSYMRKMFPDYEEQIINDPDMKTIFDVLTTAADDGYTNVNIIVGADRQSEFENLAQKYNGDLYNFDLIRVISAGVRDADADGVEGMSASKMRKAVQDDDYEAFRKGTPSKLDDGDTTALFNAVRSGMKSKNKKKVKEEYDLWEIAPRDDQKALRENYIKKNIFNVGDLVESLNTGLVGRIIRRGTSYLICVTENNVMFKSWIKDLTEAVKPAHVTGIYGVSADKREVGTDAQREYAQSMVPGQERIRNFINKYRKNK
mgnify:CR=1 FL=1|tara:strand:- start:611 stop:1858 length:1248 start_codon:yes stop_codon:yes gene_type:complete